MLFGHQHDDTNAQQSQDYGTSDLNPLAVDPETGVSLPEDLADFGRPTAPNHSEMHHRQSDATLHGATPAATPAAPSDEDDDALMELKQKALEQLSPLVSHLDQSPEEKFRTTMMMIQSSDNQALISDAYAAAQEIPDDKARAQALLDIVNEINYFTQQSHTPDQKAD